MASNKKVICMNCGREISSKRAAINDGWIVSEENGTIFCCCVCIQEYRSKLKVEAKKAKKKQFSYA